MLDPAAAGHRETRGVGGTTPRDPPSADDAASAAGRERPLAFEPGDEDAWHELARGYRLAGLLLSAHRLGLLQLLAAGDARDTTSMSAGLAADPKLLVDICRALQSSGLVVETVEGWTLTTAGSRLATDQGAILELDAMADDYRRWGELDRHARSLWRDGHTDSDPYGDGEARGSEQAARRYARRVSNRRRPRMHRLIGQVEPTRSVTVLDAWGGDGYVARAISAAWPDATCTVLGTPAVAPIAREACASHPRIAVVASDLLTGDPRAALGGAQVDVVVLSHVLQGLTSARRRELSAQVAHVLAPGGCLLSSEFVRRWNDRDSLDVLLWTIARTAANADGDALSESEQDLLLRGNGLAAVASWWVTQSTRAVLGVKPATDVEPALRVVGA